MSKNELNYNLRCNLLLIRESFRTLTHNNANNMTYFYKALNIFPSENPDSNTCDEFPYLNTKSEPITSERAYKNANDIFTNAILKGYISNINYDKIFIELLHAGIPEKFIKRNNTARMLAHGKAYSRYIETKNKLLERLDLVTAKNPSLAKDLKYSNFENYILPNESTVDAYIDMYIDSNVDKKQKAKLLCIIDSLLFEDFSNGNKHLATLLVASKILLDKILPTAETDLHLATMVLNKIPEADFTDSTYSSEQYAEFITTLAKTINNVEEEFPEFYAVAQQMKEDKSTQSVMNEISNNLKTLNSMKITTDDVNSNACVNMMSDITKLLLAIQKSTLTAQQDAEEQA